MSRSREIVLGRITGAYYQEDIIDLDNCYVDAQALDPVARIEGTNYATVRDRFSMPPYKLADSVTPIRASRRSSS